MNKNLLLLLFFTVFLRLEIRAQEGNACPTPPPPGGESCQSSCVYCDFDGYMGINNGTPSGGNTVCGSIAIHNDQWFGFVAGSTSITIDIISSNCTQGNGLQSAFFDDCSDADAITCNSGCGGCGGQTFSLTYDMFVEGQTYWLMIDGWTGDVCNFEIDVVDGSITPPPPDPVVQPQGPTMVCPGATVVYSIPDAFGAGYYHWTAPPGASINGLSNNVNVNAPEGTMVTITFGNSGGNVCVQSGNSCNGLTPNQCLPVINQPIPPTVKAPIIICNDELPFTWDEEPFPTVTQSGTFNLTSTPYDSYLGCDSLVKQTVIVKPPLFSNLPNQYICQGSCFTMAGTEFCDPGPQSIVLNSFQNCDSLVNFSITILSPNSEIGGNTPITCATQGGLTLSALNFVPGSSFQWTNANWGILGGAPTVNVNQTGIYHLVVTASGGGVVCRDTSEVLVTGNTTPPQATATGTNINCISTTAQLQGSSPTSGVTYAWTGPGINASNQFLQNPVVNLQGNYVLTVTNPVNSCTSTASVNVIADNTPPSASAVGGDITCLTTSIVIDGSTNIATPTWNWSGPGINPSNQTVENPSVTLSGNYAVTVTNPINGCSNTASTTVNLNNNIPTVSAGADQTLTCLLPNTNLQGSGNTGVAPMGILWNGPNNFSSTSLTPSVNQAGQYILTITNQQNGCVKTDSVDIASNQVPPIATAGADSIINCAQPEVFLIGTGSSAGPDFTPLWTGPGINGSNQNLYSPEVNLPGNYTLLITNTVNGCTATDAVLVDINTAQPNADAGLDQILTCTSTNGVTLNGNGSPAGVTYLWSGLGIGSNNETSQSPTVTQSDTYTLIVTNPINGCTDSDQVVVDQDANVPVAAGGPDHILNCTVNTVNFDGSASSTGGNFTYNWSGPGISGANVTAQSPTGITVAGTYNLTVTNALNNCENTDVVVVSLDVQPPTADAGNPKVLNCFNSGIDTLDGSASSTGSIYTYLWSGPAMVANPALATLQNPEINNQPGTYNLVVTNTDNTCTATDQVVVTSDQVAPTSDAGTDKIIDCVTISTSIGGTSSSGANFSYLWTGPAITAANATLATPTVNLDGTYNLVVTNNLNGCTSTDDVVVNTNAVYPTVDAGTDGLLTCSIVNTVLDGAASSTGTDFNVVWSGPGITGANQAQISPSVNMPGTYVLSITNTTNSCVETDTVVVDQNIAVPTALAGNDAHLDCQTVSAVLDGSSSSTGSNFTYLWTGAGIVAGTETDQSPSVTVPNLYNLLVTDTINGCTATDAVVVTQDIALPTADASVSQQITCANTTQMIDGSLSSSGALFEYVWQGPGINSNNFNVQSPMVGDSGTYTVIVTNIQNHCTATDFVFVDMDQELPITNAGADATLTCAITSVQLNGSQSQSGANITYLWDGPGVVAGQETSVMPTVNVTGIYNLTVTNSTNGCSNTDFAFVAENIQAPLAEAGADVNITCANSASGVTLNSTGSSTGAGISYLWSGSGITPTNQALANPTILTPGDYTITVTDAANGCTAQDVVTVSLDTDLPTAIAGADQTINCNILSVVLDASNSTSNGGTLGFTWSGPGINAGNINSATPSVSQSGTYTVTVLNSITGCQASDQVVVLLDNAAPVLMTTTDIITCQDPNGTLSVSSSLTGSTYIWQGPGVNIQNEDQPSFTVTEAGIYSVTVTAPNGCASTSTVVMGIDSNVPDGTAEGATLNCFNAGTTGVAAQIFNPPGTTGVWTGPGIGSVPGLTATVNQPGTYTFTMTTATGCTVTIPVIVELDTEAPDVAAVATDELDCGTTEVNINGGGTSTGPNFSYQWTTGNGNIISGANSLNPLVDAAGQYQLHVMNNLNGCADSLTVDVLVDPDVPSGFDLDVRDIVCFGDKDGSIKINGVVGGTEPFSFTLVSNTGGTDNQYTGLSAGEYTLSLLDGNGCTLDSSITIGAPAGELTVDLGPDIEIELGDLATVSAQLEFSTPIQSVVWNYSPGCDSLLPPGEFCLEFTYPTPPLNSYRHTITVTDINGCVDRDDVNVIVDKPRKIYVPNVFDPESSDPDNSGVRIYMGPDVLKVHKWLIFDRWGENVHEVLNIPAGDFNHAWYGKIKGDKAHQGVYVWYAKVEFIDGEIIEYKGDVTVAR